MVVINKNLFFTLPLCKSLVDIARSDGIVVVVVVVVVVVDSMEVGSMEVGSMEVGSMEVGSIE